MSVDIVNYLEPQELVPLPNLTLTVSFGVLAGDGDVTLFGAKTVE